MKYFTIITLLILAAVAIMETNADCEYDGKVVAKTGEKFPIRCGMATCQENGAYTAVGCGTYQCAPGKQTGYREGDKTKVYPDCCSYPICAD